MKRSIAACLSVAVLAAILAGCSVQQAGVSGKNPWTRPGVVRIDDNQEPNSLLKMFSHQASADDVTALLFDWFFRYDERGDPVPSLATEFPTTKNGLISKDGLRITFKLRPSAKWSDGVPVTADDVIFTWHAIMDPDNPVTSTEGYDKIVNIVADNPHQVTVVLSQPYAPAVYLFSEGSFPPLPEHLLSKYQRLDRLSYDSDPVGDGPFELKQWIHGSDIYFVPNPLYWRGRAKLDEIDMRIIPNSANDLNVLKTHEIDVLDGVTKSLYPQLAGIDGITVVKQLTANFRHLDFNTHNPILADRAVRRAIAMGIDFDKIIKDVYGGLAQRGSSWVPPMSWAANDLAPLPFDPAQAAASLDADGWRIAPQSGGVRIKDGQRLSLSISTATENQPNVMAELLLVADLHKIGIDVTVKNYATTVLFAPDGPLYGGKYDMAWIVDTEGTDPDDLGSVGCHYFPPNGANTEHYCNPQVDAAMTDALGHYDQARRRADYAAAAKQLIEDAPFVVIYWDDNVIAYNSDLKHFRPSAFITDFWDAWEWEI